jgi:ectoine hydroxylase-related dioxygenase (phytanoyl-CoA dioxygenase family)
MAKRFPSWLDEHSASDIQVSCMSAHSGGYDMEEEVEFFRRHGYAIARSVIDPDGLRSVEAHLRSNLDQCFEVYRRHGLEPTGPGIGRDLDALLKRGDAAAMAKRDRDILSGNFPTEIRLSPELWRIAGDPSLRRLLGGVLQSSDLFMHMVPSARFVLPSNHHAGVPAHRDVIYNDHMTDFVTVWVPFVEIDECCGGVRVYEDSMTGDAAALGEIDGEAGAFWHGAQDASGFRHTDCHLSPGDVLVLDKHLLHASLPNLATHPRLSLDMRFFGATGRTRKHYLDLQTMVVHPPLTGAQHDGV